MSGWILRANSARLVVLPTIAALAAFALVVQWASSQNEDGAGVVVSKKARSADVGLPIYPGAKPHKDPGSDSDSARLALWAGAFGFRLAVMQLESSDVPLKIAEYYKRELAKYGSVLDCSKGGTVHDDSPNALTCDDKRSKNGAMVFKAGTRKKQHIVEIEPNGSGATFALVYVWTKGD